MVKYLKENFFVRYRRFDSFTHVNQQLEQWIADVADKRELRQFKETPEQRFGNAVTITTNLDIAVPGHMADIEVTGIEVCIR
ncbi:IS21 ORF1 [Shigella sonnei]|nr:IS21 ORF1 [Shigella sonnei]